MPRALPRSRRCRFRHAWPASRALAASACAAQAARAADHRSAQALAAQRAASAPIRSLRAEAKIDQRGQEGRIKGRVLMFVERPDRVRFDAMTQFGPALILTSDGQHLRAQRLQGQPLHHRARLREQHRAGGGRRALRAPTWPACCSAMRR